MDEISARLFDWYDSHCRELPWRATRNPYYIWVSEIILQQTRVAQGYDYFIRFIERFPTVESLAEAAEDDVMRMWQGLGYYSRARNLHDAAKQVVAMGRFPDTYGSIRSLKGVGDYTAAAIASFAYDIPIAAVDGNVCRVWSRVLGIDDPIDSAHGKQMITEAAQSLLPVDYAAKYNLVLNIPLFILGWKLIGGKLLIGSLWAMFISSVIIDVISPLPIWKPMDPILASIFGGVAMGLSLGLIIQQGSTTGGTDLLARLLKLKLAWLPMGKLLLIIDLVVIVLVAIVFGELSTMLYGAVAMYISSLVMDGVLYGLDNAKVAYIISDHNEEINRVLIHELDKGVTIIPGQGGYSGSEKKVLMLLSLAAGAHSSITLTVPCRSSSLSSIGAPGR